MDALEHHLQSQLGQTNRLFWYRLRWNAIRTYLPADAKFELIDVGAGSGFLGDFLELDRPQGRYRFVEPIASLRTHLAEKYGDGADASGENHYGGASYITLLDVLEHQEDDRQFLAELTSKIAPGSKLILTVPAQERLWSAWDESLGHFRRYDKSSLSACLDGLSLKIDEMVYLFPELVPLGLYRAHRRPANSGQDLTNQAELPDLPKLVNSACYAFGTLSLALRRYWWTGTSLLLVATRTES